PFGRRQLVGEVLELRERRTTIERGELWEICVGARPAVLVDRDPARNRVGPGAQVLAVAKLRVRAQRAEERLLEGILGSLAPEPADEKGGNLVPVLFVEELAGRRGHRHIWQRSGRARCT